MDTCENILDQEIGSFEQWLAEFQVRPLIAQMIDDAHALCDVELDRFFKRCPDLTDQQREEVRRMVERVGDKFMHPCLSTLRQHKLSEPTSTLASTFHKVTAKLQRKER